MPSPLQAPRLREPEGADGPSAAAVSKFALRAFTAPDRGAEAALAAWDAVVDRFAPERLTPGQRAFASDLGVHLAHVLGLPGLTAGGWLSRVRDSVARLENRLRVDRIIAERPEIEREAIAAPVVVVGLPRTATTLTHRVLAGSAAHRGPLLWEYRRTGLELPEAERAAVVAAVDRQLGATLERAPGFERIHRVRADRPDECDWLLPSTPTALCFAPTPAYREWIGGRDMTDDYRYLKRALQVLQYRRRPRRWVLKSPWHLAHLGLIAEVFAGARFVWTHRDPVEAVASFCSLAESLASAHREAIDPARTGAFWSGVLADTFAAGRAQRERLPESACFDLEYRSLVEEPEARFRELCEWIGTPWTAADAARLRGSMTRRETRAPHRYRLDRYGLTGEDVERAFAVRSGSEGVR